MVHAAMFVGGARKHAAEAEHVTTRSNPDDGNKDRPITVERCQNAVITNGALHNRYSLRSCDDILVRSMYSKSTLETNLADDPLPVQRNRPSSSPERLAPQGSACLRSGVLQHRKERRQPLAYWQRKRKERHQPLADWQQKRKERHQAHLADWQRLAAEAQGKASGAFGRLAAEAQGKASVSGRLAAAA